MAGVVDWVRSNWTLLAFILGLVLVFTLLRTRPTTGIDSPQALDSALMTGQPVVVEFYSNF
jgi:hypothetical protein